MVALCREKQSTVESSHIPDPDNTDNNEEIQTLEDDGNEAFSNDNSVETEQQSSNEDDLKVHR